MKERMLNKFSDLSLFITIILLALIKNETEKNICQSGFDVNTFSDCLGKNVISNNYCCFIHFNYLGAEAKYCFEFPKKDIDNNNIKQTIKLIENGEYWKGRIQSYDIYSLQCDNSFSLKVKYLKIIYLFFLLL